MQTNNSSNHLHEIIIAKYNYNSQENQELTITKNERLLLLDDTCLWWKVKRIDSDETGYIPSNFARREKRSLLDKIISKRIAKKQIIANNFNNDRCFSLALVKFRYDAESEDEISLNKGIWINVLQKKTDGWWLVQYENQRGWFPSNYLIEKSSDSCTTLSLLNQINSPPSSSSSNALSSSSSANSNLSHIRHNSHPLHRSNCHDEYAFVIKPSKYAHSDDKLDNFNCRSPVISSDEKNLKIIEDNLQNFKMNLSSKFANEIWYFGVLSRDDAEKYLKIYGNEKGNFLIRDSERRIGNYSLSIRDDHDSIRHFRIEYSPTNEQYFIGKRSFSNLNDLIEHYQTHPVYDADHTNKLYLTKPLILNNDLN